MRLLDLFCGAGGCSVGYHRAGFTDITGVDNRPMPRYPFRFVQVDALEFLAGVKPGDFDLIAASPPCQAYCRATAWRGDRDTHPDLIAATRALLVDCGTPYVIENVQEARHLLREPVMLCGSQFGLALRRHRYFETWPGLLSLLPRCHHRASDLSFDHGGKQPESAYRAALGVPWMTVHEARQAIPPAYTEFLGRQILPQMMTQHTCNTAPVRPNPTPSRAHLEAWLRLQAPEAEVGTALCNDNCPLAVFLRSQGFPTAHVYATEWSEWHHGEEDVWHPMPAWATAFVQGIDAYDPPPYPDDIRRADQRPVTAAEALAVLTSLELPQEVSP